MLKTNTDQKTKKIIKVLSIDGGGVKGMIPVQILYRIEKDLKINIYDTFEVYAGSSVGSMIVAAIAYEKASGIELSDMYMTSDNIKKIMHKSIFDILLGPLSLLGYRPKYSGDSKKDIISSFVNINKTIYDTKKMVMITSYNVTERKPIFFKSYGTYDMNRSIRITDVIDASSAAPFYFPAVKIDNAYYVDGAISANNPTDCIYADVIDLYKNDGKYSDIDILSIGTGYKETKAKGNISKWGGLQWIKGGISILLSGTEQTTDYRTKRFTDALGHKYLRINGPIENASLDDTSDQNIKVLKEIGDKWFELYKKELMEFFEIS